MVGEVMGRGYFDVSPELLADVFKLPQGSVVCAASSGNFGSGFVLRFTVLHPHIPISEEDSKLSPQYRMVDGKPELVSWGV